MWRWPSKDKIISSVTAHTRLFAVLGHPVRHSLSPCMHNSAFQALGLDAVYLALDCPPEHLDQALSGLRALGAGGVNLTVPLKEKAVELVSGLDETARLAGAVNTVVFGAEGPVGHSTDAYGFLRAQREAFGCEVTGQRVLFLGAGGAARSAVMACTRKGAAEILLCARTESRAQELALVAAAQGGSVRVIPWKHRTEAARTVDLVVNATPMGLKPEDESPLPGEAFRPGQQVLDMVYARGRLTALVAAAQQAGVRTTDGLGMLLHQGVRSFEIWTGQPAPIDVMRQALKENS